MLCVYVEWTLLFNTNLFCLELRIICKSYFYYTNKGFFGTRWELLSVLASHPIKLIKYESIYFLGLWWTNSGFINLTSYCLTRIFFTRNQNFRRILKLWKKKIWIPKCNTQLHVCNHSFNFYKNKKSISINKTI